jgi:hypothetical protein
VCEAHLRSVASIRAPGDFLSVGQFSPRVDFVRSVWTMVVLRRTRYAADRVAMGQRRTARSSMVAARRVRVVHCLDSHSRHAAALPCSQMKPASLSPIRMAVVALAAGFAGAAPGAQQDAAAAEEPTPAQQAEAAPAAPGDGSVLEIPLDPIVIESDLLEPEPTLDQLLRKFRETLTKPPSFILSERQYAGGTLEVTTRWGRFCARPVPAFAQSGLGGDVTLAAPCAAF